MRQCNKCHVFVHMTCYGISQAPHGSLWLCDVCSLGLTRPPPCVLCPGEPAALSERSLALPASPACANRLCACHPRHEAPALPPAAVLGGALKRTTCGRWAHPACALWIPEAHLDAAAQHGPLVGLIDGIQKVGCAACCKCAKYAKCNLAACTRAWHARVGSSPMTLCLPLPSPRCQVHKSRRELKCQVCQQCAHGACTQCCHPKCYAGFHPLCARQAGYKMEVGACTAHRIVTLATCAVQGSARCSARLSQRLASIANPTPLLRCAPSPWHPPDDNRR